MKNSKLLAFSAAIIIAGLAVPANAHADHHKEGEKFEAQKTVEIKNNQGTKIGALKLKETEKGVLLKLDLNNLQAGGTHAFHIHETGRCSPDFSAAGEHFNPADNEHGMMMEEGQHAGDMPNIHVDDDGTVSQEILNTMITLEENDNVDGRHTIYDEDGSAIVIHAGADDYVSQPSGAAGDRIACAVIAEPKGETL
ncbi:MAG: superoxide dismutase family protein [Alphaproteobacteria bacterium]